MCHDVGVLRKSIDRRTLSGRRLHPRPRVLPRIRSARLEDGITLNVIICSGANPAPHEMNCNATALGGVTFPWDRARDGSDHNVADFTKRIAGEAQEEDTGLHQLNELDLPNCTATVSDGRAQNQGLVQERRSQ